MSSKSSCRIDEIIYDEKSVRPVIVSFQNGELIKGQENKLACDIYQNEEGGYIPTVATEKIIYTGEVNREEDLYNTFLCIKNKKTNKIRLIAVDQVVLKAQPPQQCDLNTTSIVDKTSHLSLNKEFGSKTAKRKIEQLEKFKISIDAVKDQLEETVAGVTIKEDDSAVMQRPTYLPPVHEDASSLEMVYRLDEIIPSHVFESLEKPAKEVLKGKINIIKSPYIKNLVEAHATIYNVKILLYIDCLLHMLLTPAKQLQTISFSACAYSNVAATYLLDNFTIKTDKGRIRPLSMKDKSACFILVLTMLYNGYKVDMSNLAVATKFGAKKLIELSRLLLFKFEPKDKTAFLKLPLPKVSIMKTAKFGNKK